MGFFHLLSKWTWRTHLQIIQIPDHSASGTHQEEHMPQKCAGLKDPVWSATFKWTDNKMQLGCLQSACNKKSTKGIAKDHPMKSFLWVMTHPTRAHQRDNSAADGSRKHSSLLQKRQLWVLIAKEPVKNRKWLQFLNIIPSTSSAADLSLDVQRTKITVYSKY